MILCVTVLMSVRMPSSMHMCVSVCVFDVGSPISHVKQRVDSFYLGNTVENIVVGEHSKQPHRVYQFSTIYIDTPRDYPVGKIYGSKKYGLVHSEKVLNAIL